MQLFLTIALCLMIGAATAYFASQRGRDPMIWFMVGVLLGIFGFLLLFLLPPVQEANMEESFSKEEKALRLAPHDYLIKDWFYYDRNRNRQGPISFEKLRELWEKAEITGESFVWSEGMPTWQKLEEVHALYTHLK